MVKKIRKSNDFELVVTSVEYSLVIYICTLHMYIRFKHFINDMIFMAVYRCREVAGFDESWIDGLYVQGISECAF